MVAFVTSRDHEDARRRRLSDEERRLWGSVARSVAPLRNSRPRPTEAAEEPVIAPKPRKAAAALRPQPVISPAAPPALAPIGRRGRQKLARGRDSIDARIDLHGMTQAQAQSALRHFLSAAQARDARYVLVVTGKGRDPEGGVLRRQVPLWLELPEFRRLIVGFETAHVGHGGDGALYVHIRRKR